MNKLLTIVIPTYNMEAFLSRCLDSVIIKDMELLDVIVVNDGSTDRSHDIAQGYADKYSDSISVIDKENGHYGTTINAGMKAARGKYFRIIDSDDYFEKGQLQAFINELKDCDADVVFTNKVEEDLVHNTLKTIKAKDVEFGKVYQYKDFIYLDQSINDGAAFNMHTMTYKTEVLKSKNLTLPGGVCYTDMIYCLVPQDVLKTLVVFNINLYHYNIGREGSSTTSASVKRNFQHILVVLGFMVQYCHLNPTCDKTVLKNRRRFLNEAFAFFYTSILKQKYISKADFEKIHPIINNCKEAGITHRKLKRYYIKHWYKTNSRMILNLSLFIYHLGHPFKK